MRATYVEPIKTPISFERASECLGWALRNQIGATPKVEVLALALAKCALETGRWKSIWNQNWGNVKAGPDYEGMYTCIVLNEVLMRNGKSVLVWFAPNGELTASPAKGGKVTGKVYPVPDGHPQTRMRAFANEYDGADQYVEFVANGRYQTAWRLLLKGDASGYVYALKAAKYFTADPAKYLKGVKSMQEEFVQKLKGLVASDGTEADVDWAALQTLVPQLQFTYRDMTNPTEEDPNT